MAVARAGRLDRVVNAQRWSALEGHFHRIRALSEDRWSEEIAAVGSGDAEMAADLQSLLRSAANPSRLLDRSAIEILAALQAARTPTLDTFKPGDLVSHYEILAAVDQGGMGAVYKARDTRLGRVVAIKFVSDPLLHDAGTMRQFEREARAASAINNPNICTVYDVDGAARWPFIVIEFLEGETLRQRLKRGPMSLAELLPIMLGVCDALAAAHARGIIHLDIKPANIFLTRSGVTKVLDFGAAAWLQERNAVVPSGGSSPVFGTARYMAPEQRQGRIPGVGADIHALGVVMREALGLDEAGARRGTDARAMARIIVRATREDPADRYPHVVVLADELRALADSRRRRRKVGALAMVVVALALIGGLSAYVVKRDLVSQVGPVSMRLARPTALAVVPLSTTGLGSEEGALAEGLTRELTGSLSETTSVPVLSASAVLRAWSRAADPLQVGRSLRASTLVLGSVQRVDERIALELRIVDVASRGTIWAQRFDEPIGKLAGLAQEAARSIARQLDSEVLRQNQPGGSGKSTTTDPKAYEDYLRAQYFFHREDVASLRNAIKYYQSAISHDPTYAAAYVGWAEVLSFGAYTERLPVPGSWSTAESLLDTALRLDPQSGLGYALRGMIAWIYHCDAARARQDLDRALELAPADLTVLDYHSYYLLAQEQYDMALAEKRRVLHADPVSVSTNAELGLYFMVAGRYDEAIAQLQATLELDDRFVPAIMRLAETYQRTGKFELAVAQYQRAYAIEPSAERLAALACAYALWGKGREARSAIARLDELSRSEHVSPNLYAQVYTALGDKPAALQWLGRASSADQPWPGDPVFDSLRGDPAFKRIEARLHGRDSCPQM